MQTFDSAELLQRFGSSESNFAVAQEFCRRVAHEATIVGSDEIIAGEGPRWFGAWFGFH